MRLKTYSIILFSLSLLCAGPARAELNLDKISDADIRMVQDLLQALDPLIRQRDERQDLARLTFDELYAPLNGEQREFLKQFEHLDARELNVKIPFRGIATGEEELTVITGQHITAPALKGKGSEASAAETRELPPQFLPPPVYRPYLAMMDAMESDIGRRLLIESGYRSSAYQMYLFVYYLKNHEYSIRETVKFVALPGYSEHGAPAFQALDFINTDGINGEADPAEFDVLPEFAWLQEHAGRYGFVLSYPDTADTGITYEPWHWRYEAGLVTEAAAGPGRSGAGTEGR